MASYGLQDGHFDHAVAHRHVVGIHAAEVLDACMVKRSEIGEFGRAWLQRHGVSVGFLTSQKASPKPSDAV